MQLIHIGHSHPGSTLVHWPARVTVVGPLIHRIRTQRNATRMMTGSSRASKCMGISRTESSSSSLSSTSSVESSGDATPSNSTQHDRKIDGLRVKDSTYGNDTLHREGSKSRVAGSTYSPPFPNSSSSSFPRLPAVPLLTEKQKQLLLRYLCISNDETSRVLMQAAARQQCGCCPPPTVREAPTAAVAGFRTAPRDAGQQTNDGATAGAAAAGSHEAAVISTPETAAVRRLGISSGRRAAVLAPWSFTSLSKNSFNSAAASRASSNAFTVADTQLQEHGVDCWTAAADVRSFQQPQLQPERHHQQPVNSSVISQPQHSSDLHECEEELRRQEQQQRQPKKKQEEVQQGEKQGQEEQQQQSELRNTAALSQNEVPCVQRDKAPGKCVPVSVCPLRPCLRRRSTVRFRSPVAVDLSAKEQQPDESIATASEKALAEVHACPSKEARQDRSAAANPIVVSSNEREKASFCCPHALPSLSCLASCSSTTTKVLDVPRTSDPPSGDSSGALRREVLKRGSTICHVQPLRCCCYCPGPAPGETVPHISGRPCCCSLDSLENDERTAAPAASRRVIRTTAPPVPLSAQEFPSPATAAKTTGAKAVNVPCRYHCDTKKAAPRCCPFCCKCARWRLSQQEVICCCCGTCYSQPFRVNEAFLTSSKDKHDETTIYYKCPAGPLRHRISYSATSSVSAEDKGEPTACPEGGRQERENKAGASGASRQEGASGRAVLRAHAPAARQHYSIYYPSHEDEGPRPCCGPGTGEKGPETVLQPLLQRVYYKEGQDKEDEEAEEGYCCYACCGCGNRQHACASHSFSQIRSLVADNNMGQNGKPHKCSKTCAHSVTAVCTALRDEPSASAAATQQNEEAAAARGDDDSPTSQFRSQCIHVCCDPVQQQQHQQRLQQHPQRQQHQQQRVSEGCCGHMAAQWRQTGNKPGRRCLCSRLPRAASTADEPPVSCADSPLCVSTESPSQCWILSANAAEDSSTQTKKSSAHKQHQQPRQGSVLQGQMPVQHGHQRAQMQQQAQGRHSPGLHADLQQRPQGKRQQQREYWCHHATSAGPTDLPSQTHQQQQVLHNHFSTTFDGTCDSNSFLQRRCLSDLQANNAALDTVASATARGLYTTPSTAPTLDGVMPSPPLETLALPTPRARATTKANSAQAGELSKSELCPRGECPMPAAVGDYESATRTLTRATIASTGAMPATAAVQRTPLTRGKAVAQPRGMSDHAAAAASAAGANTTLLLEGFLWKEAGPPAPTRHSVAGGAPPLTRKAIDALPANGRNPVNFPSAGAAAAAENVHARSFYRGTLKLATAAVQLPVSVGIDENIGSGGDSTERPFYKEKEGHVASGSGLSTRVTTAIGSSGSSSGSFSNARGAATEHRAATSAVGRVGNSTGASAAHDPASWCNASLEEEQDLQQLLRRQQQELAEQLRRLDLLEKRQEELQQPQLQRRQEWWQRLHALEQQLQTRKATLDQQRRQRGLESLSDTPRQQLFQITRQQQQQQSLTDRSGTNAKLALECKKQRRWINEHHHQPGDHEAQEYQEQQRRESSEPLLGGQWKGYLQEGAEGNALPSLVKSASLVNSSTEVRSDGTGQEFSPFETNCPAAPASLLVVSKSTRKFQPPQSVQQHHHHQHRYLQREGRRQPRGLSANWPTRQKGSLNARSRMVLSGGQMSGYVCSTGAPCFTVESEQLLLDEGEEEEQELLELQEISQALAGADL